MSQSAKRKSVSIALHGIFFRTILVLRNTRVMETQLDVGRKIHDLHNESSYLLPELNSESKVRAQRRES